MRKLIITLTALLVALSAARANTPDTGKPVKKWQVEFTGGINYPFMKLEDFTPFVGPIATAEYRHRVGNDHIWLGGEAILLSAGRDYDKGPGNDIRQALAAGAVFRFRIIKDGPVIPYIGTGTGFLTSRHLGYEDTGGNPAYHRLSYYVNPTVGLIFFRHVVLKTEVFMNESIFDKCNLCNVSVCLGICF